MSDFLDSPAAADRAIIDSYAAEFNRLEDNWKSLETKAQGIAAVAGIFTGFALNFARDLPAGAGAWIRFLTVTTVVLLIATIVLAAWGLFIRRIVSPPSATLLETYAAYYFAIPEVERRAEAQPALRENLRLAWKDAVKRRCCTNDEKADLIWWSQLHLVSAIISAALLVAAVVLSKPARTFPLQSEVLYEVHQTRVY